VAPGRAEPRWRGQSPRACSTARGWTVSLDHAPVWVERPGPQALAASVTSPTAGPLSGGTVCERRCGYDGTPRVRPFSGLSTADRVNLRTPNIEDEHPQPRRSGTR
jgi:hypothetical protein